MNNKLSQNTQSLQTCVSVTVTDLRIGNLIFSNETQDVQKITGLTEENPFIDAITFDYISYDEIEAIPLTEEWLLKFQLGKQNGYPYRFLNGFIKIRNGIYFFKYYDLEVDINSVHKLQNLYFSLKGSELQISSITEH